MKFELAHALRGLDRRTPSFFKHEAMTAVEEEKNDARETAARVLSTKGDPRAVCVLKELLKLV
jgi:hypothetical protein